MQGFFCFLFLHVLHPLFMVNGFILISGEGSERNHNLQLINLKQTRGLQIEGEQLFVDVSGLLAAAMHWKERAAHIFASEAQMSDFEDVIRTSEDIHVILPSLDDVKDAILMTKSWLKNSKPFLRSSFPAAHASRSLLKVEALKELVSQSKLLKISMEERTMTHSVLKNCSEWEHDARSLLEAVDCLFNMNNVGNALINSLIPKIECLVTMIESILALILLRFQNFKISVFPPCVQEHVCGQ